jgi:exopolysaccharide biosynthesis polyprenyl glycosylphosphotransferase
MKSGRPDLSLVALDSSSAAIPAIGVSASGPDVPRPFLWFVDGLCISTAFLAAYLLAPRIKAIAIDPQSVLAPWVANLAPQIGGEFRGLGDVAWVLLVMWAVTALALQAMGGYQPLLRQSRVRIVMSTFAAPAVGLSTIALVLFAMRATSWSRLFIFLFTVFSAAMLCVYRSSVRSYRSRRAASGLYAKSIAFVGSPASVKWLRLFFEKTTSKTEYRPVGWFSISDASPPAFAVGSREPLPCLGAVGRLGDVLVHLPIHEVVAIQSTAASEWLRELIEVCDYFRVTLRIVPEALLTGNLRDLQLLYHSDSLRLPEVVLRPRHLESDALFLKRLMDIVISAVALVALAPLFAVIAVLIKVTSPHLPIFYRWRVIGYKGTPFTGYKFSTMVADADERKSELLGSNEMQGPVFKIKNDPRVTPLGRFLRKYSLNELPQLWSVFTGDMSLVGPRPAFPHELERYELWHKRKLCIRPGITCLWQVRGRNRISNFDDWVRMDLEYIDSWSLWLDVKILARTLWAVAAGTGS